MLEDLLKVRERVAYLLATYPETRDSDKKLWLAYLDVFHGVPRLIGVHAWGQLRELILSDQTVTMESVRRTRQKFQQEGQWRGDLWAERQGEAEAVREHLAPEGDGPEEY